MPTTRTVTARERALFTAREINKRPYRTFDTETTGLGPKDQIVTWAFCDQDAKLLASGRIHPTVPMSAKAQAVNSISMSMLVNEPSFATAWPRIEEQLIGPVVIYNAPFDIRMLKQSAKPHEIAIPSFEVVCAMRMFDTYWGEWNDYTADYRWQSLKFAMSALEIELPGRGHDAIYDAMATSRVIHELARIANEELEQDFTLPLLVRCAGAPDCTAHSYCETADEVWFCPTHPPSS